jgi:acylglycerol lipase
MIKIHHDESKFLAADGTEIYRQSWRSELPARAIIAIVHGYAEHSGRYRHLATDLVEAGFAVYSFDLRGHGKSGGDRVYVDAINDYLTDLDVFLTQLRHQSPMQIFLLGHSLGGEIALRYTIDYQPNLQGVILSSPFLGRGDRDIPPLVIKLLGGISRLVPKLPTITVDASQISRDRAIVRSYLEDPLIDRVRMPLRTLVAIFENIHQIKLRQQSIALPTLIMHGSSDGIAGVIHSERLYAQISSADKSLKIYADLYHEIFNEPERATIVSDLLEWLNAHLAPV